MIPDGREFFKMSGSGNDFVVIDARSEPPGRLATPEVVQTICARGTGVGADGIVFLESSHNAAVRLTYLNADGSKAALCGNATLCTARLAVELGAAGADGFRIETDSGVVDARMTGSTPEIDLQPVLEVEPQAAGVEPASGEGRIGFAMVGVPHLVVLVEDLESVDVLGRGGPLRRHPTLRHGANVNFVSPAAPDGWRMRTYERGVESETLACGSGAVAVGILLATWNLATAPMSLQTSAGRTLRVRLRRDGPAWLPSLAGEAMVIYQGRLSEI